MLPNAGKQTAGPDLVVLPSYFPCPDTLTVPTVAGCPLLRLQPPVSVLQELVVLPSHEKAAATALSIIHPRHLLGFVFIFHALQDQVLALNILLSVTTVLALFRASVPFTLSSS